MLIYFVHVHVDVSVHVRIRVRVLVHFCVCFHFHVPIHFYPQVHGLGCGGGCRGGHEQGHGLGRKGFVKIPESQNFQYSVNPVPEQKTDNARISTGTGTRQRSPAFSG